MCSSSHVNFVITNCPDIIVEKEVNSDHGKDTFDTTLNNDIGQFIKFYSERLAHSNEGIVTV